MVEINTELAIKDLVKDKISCELDMKLETTRFTLDLVMNHTIKDISKLFNFYLNLIHKLSQVTS